MTRRYGYDERVEAEVERMARDAIPLPRVLLRKASLEEDFGGLEEDFGGVDVHYTVNARCPLQVRVRFDRPANAADIDVTLRETEPRMIEAGTYAPLWLTVWLVKGFAVAGRLVDVYRLAERADPPLLEREAVANRDGGHGFIPIPMAELHSYGALLRVGDREHWVAHPLGGNDRTRRIVEQWGRDVAV
jgi:hypothetical protein